MNIAIRRLALAGIGLSLLTVLASCVAGVGYDSDVGVGYYSPGFVEPFGYDYGGWGGGYRVGPGRGGELRPSASSHAFRGASHSRSTPSIPSGSRGGGSRGHR
jgi:hypothetical protein